METTIREMLEAGVHFGHQKSRWNPKMNSFIFTERGGVHIFDLVKTEAKLQEALKFIDSIVERNGSILFVGTKKQAQSMVKEAAESCGMPYVSERWLGGMLTNFETFSLRLKTLKELKSRIEKEGFATKKQLVVARKKAERMTETLGGITELKKLPDALFIIDIVREHNAVKEAIKLHIPVIAVVDSNADPELVDYCIPGNDDAVKAIQLYLKEIASEINKHKPKIAEENAEAKNEN
jgi:small subunit ribosomal protein S2